MTTLLRIWHFLLPLCFASAGCIAQPSNTALPANDHLNIGGIYPHLAMFNSQGECGTGCVVPWAGRLWVVTYAPHYPTGSDDKLYEITPELEQIIRPESVGGTPANRMIHRESNQLIISYHLIDENRQVRTIKPTDMPGRPTANARHLTDPTGKVFFATMEEGLYEVDVKTLGVKCWINDGNRNPGARVFSDALNSKLPGYHGKGAYTGQGQLFYSNNGEHGAAAKRDPTTPSGSLAAWGGPGKDWQMILREQFTEVTGPGGIYGNEHRDDPVWAMGWDHRSVLLMLLDGGEWHLYRLPKASFSYDGAHGWNTEWPRIREIGQGDDLLATMHGTFWHFPKTFSRNNSAGIAPRSNYLKVVGDFARWGDYVVLGCDDSAQKEFLNTRPTKSAEGAPLRSNSNLWFIKPERLGELGPSLGSGGVWAEDDVAAGTNSEPFLFNGYDKRMVHLGHRSDSPVTFVLEIDRKGDNTWTKLREISVPAKGYVSHIFDDRESGQWIRVRPKQDAVAATVWFNYANQDDRPAQPADIFKGLATAETQNDLGGVLRSLKGEGNPLGLIAQNRSDAERPLYLIDQKLEFVRPDLPGLRSEVWSAGAPDIEKMPLKVDGNSVLVVEDGRRYRLPLSPGRADDKPFDAAIGNPRRVREVVTERDLLNIAGTFYELPARNAGSFRHVRPIASHPFRIHDFCSYRGLMVFTGIDPSVQNERIHTSPDGKAAVWTGVIDELWQLGKPVGIGGPWADTRAKAGEPSDPYLMYGYDDKSLSLTSDKPTTVTIQIDPTGTGVWMSHEQLEVEPGKPAQHQFPDGFNAHWIRFVSENDATLTATLTYQ